MSYNIKFNAPCCHGSSDSVNLTYNLHDMMVEGGVGANEHLKGKTGAEVAVMITCALVDMKMHPQKYKKHNPPNGWGDYDVLMEALGRIRELAEQNPTYILEC